MSILPRDQANVSATGVLSVEQVATFDEPQIVNGVLTVGTRVAPDVDRTFVDSDGRLTVVDGIAAYNELLFVQGQSNALSSGPTTVPSEVAAIDSDRVLIWTGSAFEGYVAGTNAEPTGAYPTKWGPEAGYAIRWLADHPSGTLYILKGAVSASKIATWQSGQTNFDNVTTWLTSALAEISDVTLDAKNLLFSNGESDAIVDQTLADAYQADLTSFLADARSEWDVGLAAIMRIYNASMTYRATVRAAQNAVCYADADSYLVNMDDQTLVDTYHYDEDGVIAMGDRMYDAITTGVGYEYEAASSLAAMTGATAPSGYAATATSEFSASFAAWKAFDQVINQTTGRWATAGTGVSAATLTLTIPTAIKIAAFKISGSLSGTGANPTGVTFYGSNNGTDWTELYTSALSWSGAAETKTLEVTTRGTYRYFKWDFTIGVSTGINAVEVEPLRAAA